jgi:hypothetical protein
MLELEFIEPEIARKLDDQAEELMKLLTSGIQTARRNLESGAKRPPSK